ncbi:MAG: VOC family protein [Planctomycetaceae bacterium]|nr:VOC family protein [Planctomycetaceae bacterium]
MSDAPKPAVGTIGWKDLTVANAESVRDFYMGVAGWTAQPLDMGGYDDYVMMPPGGGEPVGGICHKRGGNADIPSQWLLYIVVADLEVALQRVRELGGEVVREPKGAGGGRFCVVKDPAGAVCGLYQSGA